jgi:DNA replication protein DnaC
MREPERVNTIIHPYLARIGKETPEEVVYTCEWCDTFVPAYQLKSTGRYVRGRCICVKEREEREREASLRLAWLADQLHYTYAWLGKHWIDLPLKEKTFETFDAKRQHDAYEMSRLFTMELEGVLILYGSYGTGKTHLLAAICNELRLRSFSSRFTTAPKLFRAIQERIYHNEDYYELIHKASTAPLLVIDDIDKAKPSEFREEVYFEVIDERTKAGLPIAISTNRLADLSTFIGGAACSRLAMGQIAVQMNGADYRMEV